MSLLNYKHLYYFYAVATDGSITRASARLNLTPQTISGQLTSFEAQIGVDLFIRSGKRLRLSQMGRLVYGYAEEIFRLGDEVRQVLKTQQPVRWQTFTIGVTDVIPKMLAYKLLRPVLEMKEPVRLICHEGEQESLLSDLAVDKLDCVLTDRPLPAGSHVKAYNHQLAESEVTFFAGKQLAAQCGEKFPQALAGKPFLLQGKHAEIRNRLLSWLENNRLSVNVIAEFDDSALMKSFGQAGYGVFSGATLIEELIVSQYEVEIVGRTSEIKERYYAISPERRLKHPAVIALINAIKG